MDRTMYSALFCTVCDALRKLEAGDCGGAEEILRAAQADMKSARDRRAGPALADWGPAPGKGHLLDQIRLRLGCSYLSDLRAPAYRYELLQAVKRTPPGSYSSAQWQELLLYLICPPSRGEAPVDAPGARHEAAEAGPAWE